MRPNPHSIAGTAAAADPAKAWSVFEPGAGSPWDRTRAGHLLRRAAFGGTPEEVEQVLAEGPRRSVERLVRPEADVGTFEQSMARFEESAIDPGTEGTEALAEWWLRRMLQSPDPFRERLTLFWHGHFGVSNDRVRNGRLMHGHIATLRRFATDRFEALFGAVLNDPAPWLGYDGSENRKAAPNETMARVVLDQVTLGPGTADAREVRDAARACSGWFVLRNQLRFLPHEHDDEAKTIRGKAGPWGVEDLVRLTATDPNTSSRLARALYAWYVSEEADPNPELLAPLVELLEHGTDVGQVVRTILASNHFHGDAAYRARVKSPVELAIGLARSFGAVVPTRPLAQALAGLGQELGRPPTTAGWVGARTWINAATTTGRANLTAALIGTGEPYGNRLFPAAQRIAEVKADPLNQIIGVLLDGNLSDEAAEAVRSEAGEGSERSRRMVQAVASLAEYQLG